MTTKPPFRPIIRTQADLERTWRQLMGPWGFSRASLWLMFIDAEDRAVPSLTEIQDCDDLPDAAMLDNLAGMAARLLADCDPGGRLAVLRSRPGDGITEHDRAWARGLVQACRSAGVPTEVVHLATHGEVKPLPYDDLAA
ncbi:hypothetical protein [Nocardioides sp. GXZ039]|uniref:hypothetical protein n=1 Tax=Nocardioides sp. GXZ039 TaxID=3136018 RepID=UPI0030F42E9D